MTIRLTFKRDVVRSVQKRWARQYGGHDSAHKETTEAIAALVWPFTAEEVDSLIGNKSWTEHRCSECNEDREVLVRIGEEDSYEDRFVSLCSDCIGEAAFALARIKSTPANGG